MLPQSNETLQVVAGIRLLAWSHLVRWDDDDRQFYARSFDDFTARWKHIEPAFGGLICWIPIRRRGRVPSKRRMSTLWSREQINRRQGISPDYRRTYI